MRCEGDAEVMFWCNAAGDALAGQDGQKKKWPGGWEPLRGRGPMPAVCAQAKRSRKSGFHWPKNCFFFSLLSYRFYSLRHQAQKSRDLSAAFGSSSRGLVSLSAPRP